MRVHALFITRPHNPDLPELLTAWDEYSVDENWEGYQADIAAKLASVEGDVDRHAIVTIDVDEAAILNILRPSGTVKGVVSASR